MPGGIRYAVGYSHKRKEVVVTLQVGSQPPVEFIMGAESFIQDLDFIKNDKVMAKAIEGIREKKDLPIDHDFGLEGGHGNFNTKDWEGKMKEGEDSG